MTIPLVPPSEARNTARNSKRGRGLSLRGNRPYNYATPVAPADVPNDYVAGDDNNVAFTAGLWGNLAGYPAFGYRLYADGVQIRPGALTGGEASPGSAVCTLPTAYRPAEAFRVFCSIGADGSGIGTFELQTDGTLVFIGEVTTGPPGSSPGTGIAYDILNSGEWFYLEATSIGGPNAKAIDLYDSGGAGVRIASEGALDLSSNFANTMLSSGGGDVEVRSDNADLKLEGANLVRIDSDGPVSVYIGGVLAFRVDSDGTVHIKTGGAIIADL